MRMALARHPRLCQASRMIPLRPLSAAILAVLALAAGPVSAQSPLTAAEFEDYVSGKTLFYAADGLPYGVEEYLPGRRVRWSFLDGRCKDGRWYAEADNICFVYEDGTGPQCWTFFRGQTGLRAQFEGGIAGDLYETRQADEPMRCLGPDIGV